MTPILEYLVRAKKQELVEKLKHDGFKIEELSTGTDTGYDLLATKGNQKIAFELKAQSELKESAADIAKRRQQAHEQGYEFRLVVVTPPRQVEVGIAGLEETLSAYLLDHVPQELAVLSSHTRIEGVCDLEIELVEVKTEGTHVVGSGMIDVLLEGSGGNGRGRSEASDTFPFHFDVVLDHELTVKDAKSIQVDTSSYDK